MSNFTVAKCKDGECRNDPRHGVFDNRCRYCFEKLLTSHFKSSMSEIPEPPMVTDSPLASQVGGDHYKKLAIQPVEYIHKNNIPFIEGSVIKYVTRWRDKGGIKDLQKAKHFIELLIELENENVGKAD